MFTSLIWMSCNSGQTLWLISLYFETIRPLWKFASAIIIWAASWQKPTKWLCAQRRLRSAWASAQSDQSSLSAWRKLGSLATHWAHSEDSDRTGRMPRLIWVFMRRLIWVIPHNMTKFSQSSVPFQYFGNGGRAVRIGKISAQTLEIGKSWNIWKVIQFKHKRIQFEYTILCLKHNMALFFVFTAIKDEGFSCLYWIFNFNFSRFSNWEFLVSNWEKKKDTFWHWEWGLISDPNWAEKEHCNQTTKQSLMTSATFLRSVYNPTSEQGYTLTF